MERQKEKEFYVEVAGHMTVTIKAKTKAEALEKARKWKPTGKVREY